MSVRSATSLKTPLWSALLVVQSGLFDFSTVFRIGIICTSSVSLFFCHGESLSISLISRAGFYQVLEYMGGGDLLNLLIERDVFEEDFTRFYAAEVSGYPPFNCLVPGYQLPGSRWCSPLKLAIGLGSSTEISNRT